MEYQWSLEVKHWCHIDISKMYVVNIYAKDIHVWSIGCEQSLDNTVYVHVSE